MVPCLSIPEETGWLHSQHSSIMGSLQPRFLEGCSSQQLTTGSLSHSTVFLCTEKDVMKFAAAQKGLSAALSVSKRSQLHELCSSTQPDESLHTGQPGPGTAELSDTSSDGLQPFYSHHVTHVPGAFCTPGKSSSALGMNFTQTTPKLNKTSSSAHYQPCQTRHQAESILDSLLNSAQTS